MLTILACCEISAAYGQTPTQSVNIPLQYVFDSQTNSARLSINIGINGGAPRPYLFDTGSTLFNATFDPNTWGGYSGQASVPTSTVPNGNNVQICYSGSPSNDCRGYTGNIVQVPSLSFYLPDVTTTTGPAPAATLNASPGFQISAAFNYTDPTTTPATNDNFPSYFLNPATISTPQQEGLFYGVFGSRISVSQLPKESCPGSPSCYVAGGVLGQAVVPGAARQGFIVAANGQTNPANQFTPNSAPNSPIGNVTVSIGGQPWTVTSCNPCVTVGLTPELIGQFAPVGMPTSTSASGLVQWVAPTSNTGASLSQSLWWPDRQQFGANGCHLFHGDGCGHCTATCNFQPVGHRHAVLLIKRSLCHDEFGHHFDRGREH